MRLAAIRKKADALFNAAGFISNISNEDDYSQALALMDELVEDYATNRPLIVMLADTIERWEWPIFQRSAANRWCPKYSMAAGVSSPRIT